MTQGNSLLGKLHLNEILNASAQDKSDVVSNQINISMRRDVCLRTQCERVKRTLSPFFASGNRN